MCVRMIGAAFQGLVEHGNGGIRRKKTNGELLNCGTIRSRTVLIGSALGAPKWWRWFPPVGALCISGENEMGLRITGAESEVTE